MSETEAGGSFFYHHIKKVCHFAKHYHGNSIDIKLVFSSFNIGHMSDVKDRIPCGLRAGVVYKFLCAGCNAKPAGILPGTYMSTCSVIGPLTFSNSCKILSSATLHAPMAIFSAI